MPPSSPRSAKRKIQDVATSDASLSSDRCAIFKKICADDLGKSLGTDKDKENDVPMPSVEQMPQGEDPKVGLAKVATLSEVRGRAVNGTVTDQPIATVSVAARAALFESEISKSCGNNGRGTLPLKRPTSRPPLKQSFSSLNVGRPSFMKTPALNAAAKLSAHSAEELGAVTPPPAENREKSLARPGTPKKPELPGLAIIKEPDGKTPATKTDAEESGMAVDTDETVPDASAAFLSVGDCEDADDSVFENGSLSLPHEEDDIAHEVSTSKVATMSEERPDEGILHKTVVPAGIDQTAQTATAANKGQPQGAGEDDGQTEEASTAMLLETETSLPSAKPLETETSSPAEALEMHGEKSVVSHASQHGGAEALPSAPDAESSTVEDVSRVQDCSMNRESVMTPEEAAVFDEIDDILNDAMDSECSDTSYSSVQPTLPQPPSTPPRNSRAAEQQQPSTHLMSTPKAPSPRASTGQRTAELPRTISSFRKQQRDATPQQCSSAFTPSKSSKDAALGEEEQLSLDNRLKALQDNVLAQQTVISQATQALNLCQASAEFLGSAEQVEGEKLLLIATQKRLAYLNEIQRLKVGGDNPASELPRGSLVIKKIRFPINKDALKTSSGYVYHFLCMVQYRGKVHASQLLSSDNVHSSEQNCLEFDNEIEYSSMDEDFQVQIDLYGLKTVSPVVPHDKKYHIKKETIKMKLSSRGRKTDSIFMTPGISSPGGPNAVRTSSFQSLGSFILTTSNCHQSVFALSKVPGSFCIEGKAFVELQLHADHGLEHHGFLTLFEEVGGFGAWTRLWCLLKGSHLVLWRYPEEEDSKPPIDTIDLRQCITKEVSRLPRTECARAHTFEVIVVESLGSRHRDTLTTTRHATVAVTRHRLSADSKDDLNVWCTAFNRVLSCIRKWDPEAYKAMDVKQFV
uniref:Actin-binding protein anillin n=1 Tax=Rhipicephalus appendiculatus TaxID=34631 RepID=A0A131YX03_RHIAP